MISFEDARFRILSSVAALPRSTVALDAALGMSLAGPVTAAVDVPPFANTAMDGFAVRAADCPGTLAIVGDLPAGSAPSRAVGPGEAIRIMTGAPIPEGADAVAQVEICRVSNDRVTVLEGRRVGENLRPAGGDVTAGTSLFGAGVEITPAVIGSLATIGVAEVEVVRRPRVAVLSTGDEVREVGTPLAPGKIYDSNRPALLAAVRECGFEPMDVGMVDDEESALEKTVRSALEDTDALITSGGVSVGDYDFVKAVLARLGEVDFWQVAQRPAKPLAFGLVEGKPVFGLPGNPVSALVSFEEHARPALRKMAGHRHLFRPERGLVAGDRLEGPADLLVFFRVVVDDGVARLTGGQASNVLSALALADALALLPVGDSLVEEGQPVMAHMIREREDH